ncbi:MAG: alpha/beta hydrolase [Anaerolineales bacterium]|nr:alpha/beta hydrolase [Anaerolineales bacterium]
MPVAQVAGQNIYYIARGAQGTPVVFIHGAAGNHLVWGMQVHALGEVARAVALDLPGHGRSDPPGRTSVEAYRDVIVGLLDALGFDRAVIVGHSMGGAIAQTLALSHPDRVAGLGLVGTGARLRVLPAILDGVLNDFESIAGLVVENSYAPGLNVEFQKRAEDEFRACPASVTHGDFSACNQFDVMARLAGIRAPTLVVCGREDRMTPAKYSVYLATQIPNAYLVLIDHAGHSVMIEQPDETNKTLLDFVELLQTLP